MLKKCKTSFTSENSPITPISHRKEITGTSARTKAPKNNKFNANNSSALPAYAFPILAYSFAVLISNKF